MAVRLGRHDGWMHQPRDWRGRWADAIGNAGSIFELNAASATQARELTGRDVDFDWTGLDLELAREAAGGILESLEDFPGVPLRRVYTVGDRGSRPADDMDDPLGGYAAALPSPDDYFDEANVTEIRWNADAIAEDFAANRRRHFAKGYSVTESMRGAAVHEFGHVLAVQSDAEELLDEFAQARGADAIAREVSGWAANIPHEFPAEVFAMVRTKEREPTPLAIEAYQLLIDAYGRQFGDGEPQRRAHAPQKTEGGHAMRTLAMVSQCASCKHLSSWVTGGDGTTCAAYPEGIPDALWDNDVDHRRPAGGDHGVQWETDGQPFPAWVFDAAGGERAYPFVPIGETGPRLTPPYPYDGRVRVAGGPQWIGQDRDRHGRFSDSGVRASLAKAKTVAEIGSTLAAELRAVNGDREVKVDFGDADAGIARQYAEGILRGQERYPRTPLTRVKMSDHTPFGQVMNDTPDGEVFDDQDSGVIMLGSEVSRDPELMATRLKELIAQGYAMEGASPLWIGAHEFGHVVNNYATRGREWPYRTFAERESWQVVDRLMDAEGVERPDHYARQSYIIRATSGKAGQNMSEAVSEALADVLVSDSPGTLSRAIVDALDLDYADLLDLPIARQRSWRRGVALSLDDEWPPCDGKPIEGSRRGHVRKAGGKHYLYQWRDPGGKDGGQWIDGPPTGLADYTPDWLDDIFDQIARHPDPAADLATLKLPDLKVLAAHAGMPKTGAKPKLVGSIVGHAKGERPVVAAKAPRKPAAAKATAPRAPAIKGGVWVLDELGAPVRVPRDSVEAGTETFSTKVKAQAQAIATAGRPKVKGVVIPPGGGAALMSDDPDIRKAAEEEFERHQAAIEAGRAKSTTADHVAAIKAMRTSEEVATYLDGHELSALKLHAIAKNIGTVAWHGKMTKAELRQAIIDGTGGFRENSEVLLPGGFDRPAKPKPPPLDALLNPRKHGPGTRVYWEDDQTGKRIYGTVAKAGRFTVVDWDGGRRERIDSRKVHKDIRVMPASVVITNDAVGSLAIRLREAHGLEHDEAVARARQILAERNPGAMFEMDAPSAPEPESDRKSAGSMEIADLAYRLMKAHGLSHNEAIDRATEMEAEREARVQAKAKDPATLAKAHAKVDAGKKLTEAELVSLIAEMQAEGPPSGAIFARRDEMPTLESARAGLKGVRPQRLRDMARELGIDPVRINRIKTKGGLLDEIAPVLYAKELAEWMERNESVRDDGEGALPSLPADGVPGDRGPDDVLPLVGAGDRAPGGRPDGDAGGPGAGGPAVSGALAADNGREVGGGAPGAGGDAAGGRGPRDGRVVPVFRPRSQADLAPNNSTERLAANIEALETLRAIQLADRPATAEEQAKLARWSGWGSIPKIFKEPPDADLADAQFRLKELLSPGEWAAARRTIRNAHYTDAEFVEAMWHTMRELGFEGGEVLEPGSGSGTFMGMVPEDVAGDTHVTGVELDPTTAAIARALYPNQTVRAESFTETETNADGMFDAAIGNVPFSDTKFNDPVYNPGRKHNMHNHFILKSLRMTRPGGLVAVITSRYTMDSVRPEARQDMARLGDLVGAVRLPSRAHEKAAGTSVVTDVLIFRRRKDDTPYAGLPFEKARTIEVDGRDVSVNELFIDNPDMVLGKMAMTTGFKDAFKVQAEGDVGAALRGALARVVADARVKGLTQTEGRSTAPTFAPSRRDRKPDGYLQARPDGTFTRLQGGVEVPLAVPSTQHQELAHLLRLRDTAVSLIDVEVSSEDETDEMRRLRAELNDLYDSYVTNPKYGPVGRYKETRKKGTDAENDIEEVGVTRTRPPVMRFFRGDPYSSVVRALEEYDLATNTAKKTDIFRHRTIAPRTPIDHADNPADALAIALDDVGEVDLERVGDLLGEDDESVVRQQLGSLVYDDPATGRLVPRAEYLSGNIRRKLTVARRAAANDSRYAANVEALERVMPADLTPAEIRAKMGAGWIPTKVVQDFLREILRDPGLTVSRVGAKWNVDGKEGTAAATKEWGTTERDATKLAMDLLMSRPIKVEYKGTGGNAKFDQDRTDAAQAKALEMAARFEAWAWENPERSRQLQTRYNKLFNSLVLRSYDGTPMELPGMAREGFYEYPHRYQGIRRIINEPSVGLWHEVGSGKTSVMVISAMEMRRLGLVRKPAIVVPNHMLEQMLREFRERYPQARLLGIGSDDLKSEQDRRDIIARAATGDWDAVILTHGAFKRIPVSTETEDDYLKAETEPMRRAVERRRAEVIEEVRAQNPELSERDLQDLINKRLNSNDEKEKDPTLKDLEGLIEKAEENVKEKQGDAKRDPGLTFERTGIDYLFVDEAHTYKNLRTVSRQPNMGIPGSIIATDLHQKLHYLRSKNKRVATLATATPIANSVGEAYTMMRYLRPDLLEEMQLDTFDDFASNFGEVVSRLEVAPTGGLRTHSRFARFVNVPEFLKAWLVASDVKTAEDLKDIVKVPLLAERVDADGNRSRTPDIVVVPPSQELQDFIATLVYRAQNIPYPPEKGDDNMLKITGEGRAAALDLRMVGLSTDAPQKLDVAADRIAAIYEQNKDRVYTDKKGESVGQPGALQLVFSDIGTPTGGKRKKKRADADDSIEDQANDGLGPFVAYEALRDKLAERGIPRSKVKFIHEAGSDQEKAEMFAAARDGRIAVLVGSTNKMGVGTNVQKRAIALHHLDAPWRPADVQQREGRIIRQGNDNPEVQVIRYVTEQSFDSYIWQAITTKGTFINQIMRGSPDVREMEDIGDFALSAAQVTALGTGNPYLMEHADAKADLTLIERRLSIHEADQRGIPKQIAATEADIVRWQRIAAEADAALTRRTPTYHDDKNFRMTVAGTAHTDRSKAYEALRVELRRVASRQDAEATTIGEFGGIPIRAIATEPGVTVELVGVPHREGTQNIFRSGIETYPVFKYFTIALDALPTVKTNRIADIETAKVDIEAARARIGRPFPEAEKLEAARRRFEKVDVDLKAELAKRGETLNDADDVAARREAKLKELRDKLDSGGGFEHLGELTSWLEADPSLAGEIPGDRGKAWGKLTPRGQLLVVKDEYGKAFDIKIPRTMKSYKPMLDFRTQRDAKAFADALEDSGIPWNTGVDLNTWQAPGGASAEEVINRIRGERFGGQPTYFSDRNQWLKAADALEARRLIPERFRDTLLSEDRYGELGVNNFARLDREHRELILGVLRGAPENDLQAAVKLREFGLSKDEGKYFSLQRFVLAAALKLEADYRSAGHAPLPLDDLRKGFGRLMRDVESYPIKRARIEQILTQADMSGDLDTAVNSLRALAAEMRNSGGDRYSAWQDGQLADAASSLADYIEQRFRVAALREQTADWSDAELRALANGRGVAIQPYDDRAAILARLAAAGVTLDVAESPAGLFELADVRAFLNSFNRPRKDQRHG